MLFTFPSRYLFTIGRQLVFSLTRWSARIHTRLHLYRVTQELPRRVSVFGYGPFTLYGAIFHSLHLTFTLSHRGPTTPPASRWFGLFRFRSPLLTESFSLSFPLVTEMFHFTRFALPALLYSGRNDSELSLPGYPIRTSPDQSLLTAPRGISSFATSFFGS